MPLTLDHSSQMRPVTFISISLYPQFHCIVREGPWYAVMTTSVKAQWLAGKVWRVHARQSCVLPGACAGPLIHCVTHLQVPGMSQGHRMSPGAAVVETWSSGVMQDSGGGDGDDEDDADGDMAYVGLGIPPPVRPLPDPFQPHWTQR